MIRWHAWMFFAIGVVAGALGIVLHDPVLMVVGGGLMGLPHITRDSTATLAAHAESEQSRLDRLVVERMGHWDKASKRWVVEGAAAEAMFGPGVKSARMTAPPAYPDHPEIAPLTHQYLAGTLDVDQYTEQVEALPWTPTDSSRRAATPQGFRYAHSVLPDGAATSMDASSTREAFTQPYSGAVGPSNWIVAGRIEPGDITCGRITVTEHQHDWRAVAMTNQVICNTCGARRHWWEIPADQEPFAAGRYLDNPGESA